MLKIKATKIGRPTKRTISKTGGSAIKNPRVESFAVFTSAKPSFVATRLVVATSTSRDL
jgi:hypothetical protein